MTGEHEHKNLTRQIRDLERSQAALRERLHMMGDRLDEMDDRHRQALLAFATHEHMALAAPPAETSKS